MSFKNSQEFVSAFFIENGYILCDEYLSSKSKMKFLDSNGYKFYLSFDAFKTSLRVGSLPAIVGKENPYSVDNILLWVSINLQDISISEFNEFINAHEKNILVMCKNCYREWTTCWNFLQTGRTCLPCKQRANGKKKRIPFSRVISEYSSRGYTVLSEESDFGGTDFPVRTKCNTCYHIWNSSYHRVVLSNNGCPVCKESKGEKAIAKILNDNDIFFERQKRYKDCKRIKPLPFDFYLPEYNLLIEYNGEQHYDPIDYFGGDEHLSGVQESDNIKMEYCHKNNIDLLVIPYWNKKIDETIFEKINLGGK